MRASTEGFDVVVVGAGAAGCAVAARLFEPGSRSVLLLEAGPDLRAKMPAEFRDGWRLHPEFDWGYTSEPDERGLVDDLRRGKLVGGTSWLTRFALRGSPTDYDEWAALGNPGWAFDDVLPYFRRLETDAEFGDQDWHGDRGPIPVTRYPDLELTEIAAAGLDALEAVGFQRIEDHNQPGAVGVGRMPMSSRDGIRVAAADAYLPLDPTSSSLAIRSEAHVAEVVFEGDGTCAVGVRLQDGTVVEAGWVVLSAGTYGSAPILMRSGIGPPEHLRALGIPVRLGLPGVGSNLADHAGVDIDSGYRGAARPAPVLHLAATFHSQAASSGEAPDLMLWLSDPGGDPPVFEIDVVLLRPQSRGSVLLRSADPADPPRIELPAVREPFDLDRLAEGYLRGLEVARRPELRRLCVEAPEPDDKEGVTDMVRANAYSVPHVVGTCSMGPRPDEGAVVDAAGRVHGTERLSVVDASIIPNGPSAFTHLPTLMLAERLSERIDSPL